MNMNVRVSRLFKKNAICINIICILISEISYANYPTVYGLDAADSYKLKHPNSTFIIQAASFADKENAKNYQRKLQKSSKYKVNIDSKIVHNKKVYAVIIGPIKPSSKQQTIKVISTINRLPASKKITQKSIFSSNKVSLRKPANDSILQSNTKRENGVLSSFYSCSNTASTQRHPTSVELHTKSKQWLDTNKYSASEWLKNSNWYLSIGGGEQFPNGSNTLRVNNDSSFPAPYNIDVYSGSSRSNGGIFTLTGGRSWKSENYKIQAYSLGVMWQYLFKNNLTGQITQYSDPTFLNYNYQLSTTSNVILGYSKINLLSYKKLLPYFNVGLGGSINNTKKYHEEALEFVTARVSPQFQKQTNTQFAYLLGAGIDVLANDNLSISAGYNYLNIGSLSTGYGLSTWSAARLNYGSSSTNEVLLTLNYKFNKTRILF